MSRARQPFHAKLVTAALLTAMLPFGAAQAQLFPLQGVPVATSGPANTMTVSNASGVALPSYPLQFGRPFTDGAIPHAPVVLINGSPVPSQSDVKNRYPDGSAEFAVIAAVIPPLSATGSVTMSFQDSTAVSTPLTLAQMEALLPPGAATITLAPPSGETGGGSADAGTMLAAGFCKPWTQGSVAQTMICADDTTARTYDIGINDTYHPFRPRFYVTFWPGSSQVAVRAVGENGLSTEMEDLAYTLTITSNGTTIESKNLTGSPLVGTIAEKGWAGSRWSKSFWIGGTPSQEVNIDENLPYLESTRFLPNFDPSITIPATQVTSDYNSFINAPHDIYDGSWDGGTSWLVAQGTAGDSNHIGPYPLLMTKWLLSPSWQERAVALGSADLAAAWPMSVRESDPTRRFQRSDAVGSSTGLGRFVSVAGRPLMTGTYSTAVGDTPHEVGTIAAPNVNPWTWDDAHQPSVFFPAYVETGDPWYLDMLGNWAAVTVAEDDAPSPYVCTTQTANCDQYRGPTGAYGGIFGYNAPRAVAWTLRGRVEAAFAEPDGTPEKSYLTYMVNDALSKWEADIGITGTAFTGNAMQAWVHSTLWQDEWSENPGDSEQGKVPPLGNMASTCNAAGTPTLCGYSAATQTSWGLTPGATGSLDDPWMNYYMEYALGRATELGFAAQKIQAWSDTLPISIISSANPWFIAAYVIGVEQAGGGFYPTIAAAEAADDPTSLAGYVEAPASVNGQWTGRQTWVQPGLAMAVDQGLPGAASAWNWYNANDYSLVTGASRSAQPRWAIVPRTDTNVLPAQPTSIP